MAKNIFVSYNFNDSSVVNSVKTMLQSNGGKIDGKFVFVEDDVSRGGDHAIDREIKRVQSSCDTALFIIGNNSHNSPWINREAQLAKSGNLKIVITHLPESSGGVPSELKESRYPVVKWVMSEISRELNRC